MTEEYEYRWLVVCDDEIENYASQAAARRAADWHNNHPANQDIRAFGGYTNVDGQARVLDLGQPINGRYYWADGEEGIDY